MSACEQYGHAWYTRTFGGIGCGRCGQERSAFCMIDGHPVPHDEHSHALAEVGLTEKEN